MRTLYDAFYNEDIGGGRMPFPVSYAASLIPLFALAAAAQTIVLTYQYDNSRAGTNSHETVLTPANVNQTQFGKLFSYSVDGEIYGQPLYFAGVNIAGKGNHNVVFVVTEHDSVYTFDADSAAASNSAPLWKVSFLTGRATTVPAGDLFCDQITPEIGITSTPVIDPGSGTLYTVAMTKESGAYVQRLHALDVASGAERPGSPVVIQASVPGTGEGGSVVSFVPKNYKQRPGLLLLNGVVYTAWSSHCDIGKYHGWLIGYDAKTLQQVAVYNNTPNGSEGSFWASGAAPAADSEGNIYLVAGNGTFDAPKGGPDLGQSYIKLSSAGKQLSVLDYFAPFNADAQSKQDEDLGSAGTALLGDEAGSDAHRHLMTGAGKEGRIYVLDRDNLGKWNPDGDQVVASIPGAIGGLFGNPAYFNKTIYFCGVGDQLKAYSIDNATISRTPTSVSATAFDYPGCVPSISANGAASGIVWVLDPGAVLRAYDAADVSRELYNSNQNRSRDALGSYVKFTAPTVVNGKVYAGTNRALVVYGLIGNGALMVANAASGEAGIAAPGSIISLYGTGLSGQPVQVDGAAVPILFSSATQINAQVPFETPLGAATVTAGAASVNLTIQRVAPGLFLLDGSHAAVLNSGFSVNSPSQPAAAGSAIAAYLTGLGAVDNGVATGAPAPLSPLSRVLASVTATIGDQPATVLFAGLAPGFAGLYQVNLIVPQLVTGDYPLVVSADGVRSNAGIVSIR